MSEGYCVTNPDTCGKIFKAGNIISIACYILRTIFTAMVVFIIFKRRQFTNMYWLARLAFVGYIVQWLFITIYMVFYVNPFNANIYVSQYYLDLAVGLSFYEIHWLIAAHYLRVACLLRLLFIKHEANEFEIMQKRDRCLMVLTISYSVFIAVSFIAITFSVGGWLYIVTQWIWAACKWSIVLVNLFAMRYIYKRIGPLK